MRADDLHDAVGRIARILDSAGIRAAVDGFRVARGEARTVAAARLGHAGAVVAERFQALDDTGHLVLRSLHLADLATQSYWQQLIVNAAQPGPGAGEIVKLGVRLMFATQNLPGLTRLLASTASDTPSRFALERGEVRLVARLSDAGERASDPDRVARSIDGIDMLYSACASIARRPAMDLRLDGIDGDEVRDMHFTGGRDALGAVSAVLGSIPDALAELDEDAEIDLDAIVASLPVFADLQRLASLGSFSEADLKDIGETMHQGALLALESGVVLVAPALPQPEPALPVEVAVPPPTLTRRPGAQPEGGQQAAADRHYDEYLRERAAMQAGAASVPVPNGQAADTGLEDARSALGAPIDADRARRDEVEELLRSLGRARDE